MSDWIGSEPWSFVWQLNVCPEDSRWRPIEVNDEADLADGHSHSLRDGVPPRLASEVGASRGQATVVW